MQQSLLNMTQVHGGIIKQAYHALAQGPQRSGDPEWSGCWCFGFALSIFLFNGHGKLKDTKPQGDANWSQREAKELQAYTKETTFRLKIQQRETTTNDKLKRIKMTTKRSKMTQSKIKLQYVYNWFLSFLSGGSQGWGPSYSPVCNQWPIFS